MALHAYGDSHVCACFGRIAEVNVHHTGPVTMHRVGRDGAEGIVDGSGAVPGDTLIFVFGEIDVRAHLTRPFSRDKRKKSAQQVAADYVSAVEGLAGYSLVLCSVVPPAYNSRARSRAVPVYGSIEERVALTRQINDVLSHATGASYLDVYSLYADERGALREEMSDGHVHIAAASVGPIRERLAGLLGRDLTLLPLKAPSEAPYKPPPVKLAAKVAVHHLRRLAFNLFGRTER